jgi:hypothetical protein
VSPPRGRPVKGNPSARDVDPVDPEENEGSDEVDEHDPDQHEEGDEIDSEEQEECIQGGWRSATEALPWPEGKEAFFGFLCGVDDVADLDEGEVIIYRKERGLAVGRVLFVWSPRGPSFPPVAVLQPFGTYKKKGGILRGVWKPAYDDSKENKELFTVKPKKDRHTPCIEYAVADKILVRKVVLSNSRVPADVAAQVELGEHQKAKDKKEAAQKLAAKERAQQHRQSSPRGRPVERTSRPRNGLGGHHRQREVSCVGFLGALWGFIAKSFVLWAFWALGDDVLSLPLSHSLSMSFSLFFF